MSAPRKKRPKGKKSPGMASTLNVGVETPHSSGRRIIEMITDDDETGEEDGNVTTITPLTDMTADISEYWMGYGGGGGGIVIDNDYVNTHSDFFFFHPCTLKCEYDEYFLKGTYDVGNILWENEVHLKVDLTVCVTDLMNEENLTSEQLIVDAFSDYLLVVGGNEVTMTPLDMQRIKKKF